MDTVGQDTGFDNRVAAKNDLAERVAALERRFDNYASEQNEMAASTQRVSFIPDPLDQGLRPQGRSTFSCCVGILVILVVMGFMISDLLTPHRCLNRWVYGPQGRRTNCRFAVEKDEIWKNWWSLGHNKESQKILNVSGHVYVQAAVLGQIRSVTLQASVLTIIGYFCIVLAALVPTVIVSLRPEKVSRDFENKGTLSNVCQDVACPHGRVFASMLFTGSLLMLVSAYPKCIYSSWFPMTRNKYDTLFRVFQGHKEKIARSAWAAVPNVGLMLTAALPSLTDSNGLKQILTTIHTVAAPLSLVTLSLMETTQLSYGENAFAYFFCSDENSGWDGPLMWSQRMRVVIVCYLWAILCLFFSMQIYLYSEYCGLKTTPSYTFALKSLYAEIAALLLAYGLPAFQATRFVYKYLNQDMASVFNAAAVIQTLPPPGMVFPGKPNSLFEVANLSNHSMRAIQYTKFAKHLRAGADGLSFF